MRGKCPEDAPASVTCGDALGGENDRSRNISCNIILQFQSTPSVGRATLKDSRLCCCWSSLKPCPPWGGRQSAHRWASCFPIFQSTPSVGRATSDTARRAVAESVFQSTSSARRTTAGNRAGGEREPISIHVLREEDDLIMAIPLIAIIYISIHVLREEDDNNGADFVAVSRDFNPRPPRGGRRQL